MRYLFLFSIMMLSWGWASDSTTPIRIVFLGDSITEGYGVPKEKAYPVLVEAQLKLHGITQIEVINAGISGSTSASGEGRLRWHLKKKPDILILALGANDGLRGTKVSETRKNLEKIVQECKKNKIEVLLAGMQMPPNYGKAYTEEFKKIFFDIAKQYQLDMIPFLLDGVAGHPELNQEDGIHPNEKGQKVVADQVTPKLEKLIVKRLSQN